ncbi:MAG: hypothetical protein NTU54_01425 [Candidatus Omnitrophica bacterium]|nr:hypothetical protein [Candidatus Omnitrophota bacterium]
MNLALQDFLTNLFGLSIIIAIFFVPLFLFFRHTKNKTPLRLAILFCLMHFIVVLMSSLVSYITRLDLGIQKGLLFLIGFLDMPTTLIIALLGSNIDHFLTPRQSADIEGFIFFGGWALLGSIQYFLIGLLIGWIYKKKHSSALK